jgi:hypothetical protein
VRLSSIRINGAAIEQGDWVDDIPLLPGVRLKVRAINNLDYRRLEAKLIRALPRKNRVNGLDPKDIDAIETRCLAETILVGWDGIEGDDGEPLEFSQATAAALIGDPDYAVFRNAVSYAARTLFDTKTDDAEEDAGN